MHDTKRLESMLKWCIIISLATLSLTYIYKDEIPSPQFYEKDSLTPPNQTPTDKTAFIVKTNNQEYSIIPKYDYELTGVIVSLNNANAFGNIWHHKRWKDFINVRDLCVIWGKNVSSGIYQKIDFSSDSWTCWYSYRDRNIGNQFKNNALSNNHLLTDRYDIKHVLMSAEIGDVIQLRGVLAAYENNGSDFKRGTSITRDDDGNGACETIFLSEFQILKKANPMIRNLYHISKWLLILSSIAYICLIIIIPYKKY
jgi:hypothetical protein